MRFRKGAWIFWVVAAFGWFAPSTAVRATVESGLDVTVYNNYWYNGSPPLPTVSGRPVVGTTSVSLIDQNFDSQPLFNMYEDFVVKYEGYITSPVTMNITFYPYADDGTQLYIDGVLSDNNWRDKGGGGYPTSPIPFIAGQSREIVLWFYENGGGAWVTLYWDIGNGLEVVPASAFTKQVVTPTTTILETTTTIESTTTTWEATTTVPTTTPTTIAQTTTVPATSTTVDVTTTVVTTTTQVENPSTTTSSSSTTTTTEAPPPQTTTTTEPPTTTTSTTSTTQPTTTTESTTTTVEETTTTVRSTTSVPSTSSSAPQTTVPESTTTLPPVLETTTTVEISSTTTLPEPPVSESVEEVVAAITNPEVVANLTTEQAQELFESLDIEELSTEELTVLIEALQEAPDEVKEAFEESVNVFDEAFNNYVPSGSTISVAQRRTVIGATAVIFILPVPVPTVTSGSSSTGSGKKVK